MIEENKYRAQFFQISGLSCMAPMGKLFLDIKDMGLASLNIAFLIHITFAFLLFYFGIILINRGLEILEEGK